MQSSRAVSPTGKAPIRIVVDLPSSSYFMSGIRDLSKTLAKSMAGFSEQWAYRFQSVVDELANNAIEFGSKPGEMIRLTFISSMHEFIEVFVQDSGTGKGGRQASEIQAFVLKRASLDPAALSGIRGRGLAQIVSKWADTLEFEPNERGGITAHVIKKFQKDESLVIPV